MKMIIPIFTHPQAIIRAYDLRLSAKQNRSYIKTYPGYKDFANLPPTVLRNGHTHTSPSLPPHIGMCGMSLKKRSKHIKITKMDKKNMEWTTARSTEHTGREQRGRNHKYSREIKQ